MRTGQQLHRVGQIAVPGDWAVMVAVETDDLRQDMRVAGVALGSRGGVPLPVAGRRERVDRVHLVSGRPQCPYPRPAISLDPDDNLSCYLLGRQFRPVRRSMLSEQCVQPGDARQALRQAHPHQPATRLVLNFQIVVVLSPIVSDEQQRAPTPPCSINKVTAPGDLCNLMIKCSRRGGHDISSAVQSPATGGRTVCQ